MSDADDQPVGAYGLRLEGLERGRRSLVPAPPAWPTLRIERSSADGPAPERLMAADRAVVPYLGGAWAAVEREARRVRFRTPTPLRDAELLHPFLSTVAATFARWDGREALHGGAVVGDDGAWVLLAPRGAGKSTAVAALGLAGRRVVADDLVVVDHDHALAGPAFVDLRPDAAVLLGAEGRTETVRDGTRRRLAVRAAPAAVPLRGLVFLTWGPERRTARLGPAERLARLAPCRASGGEAASPERALALARLPGWVVERPRDAPLPETVETLSGILEGSRD